MNNTLGILIRKKRESLSLSRAELAKMLDLGEKVIYDYEKGTRTPHIKRRADFIKILGIDIIENVEQNVPLTAAVLPTPKEAPKPIKELKPVPFEDFMEIEYIPLVAQAGYGKGWTEAISDRQTILVPKEFEKGKYIVTDVEGDSMDDGSTRSICDGDKILLKELDPDFYTKAKIYYKKFIFAFALKDDGIVVKQVIEHNLAEGYFMCHSWNKRYNDFKINISDVSAVFYVKKIVERIITFKLDV